MLIYGKGAKYLLLNFSLSHWLLSIFSPEFEEKDRHPAGHSEGSICNQGNTQSAGLGKVSELHPHTQYSHVGDRSKARVDSLAEKAEMY